MPNPKRRHSKQRTAKRRSHDFLTVPNSGVCPNCNARKLAHTPARSAANIKAALYLPPRRTQRNSATCWMLTDIVLDAMGSDKSPEPELRGAIAACRQFPVRIHLVGPEERIGPALKDHLRGERLPIEVSTPASGSAWTTRPRSLCAARRTAACVSA